MTIIRLHHHHPRCPINCTSIPLLILPLKNLTVQGEDGAAVALLLANLSPAHVRQVYARTATNALTKLEHFFMKHGWMPKEA